MLHCGDQMSPTIVKPDIFDIVACGPHVGKNIKYSKLCLSESVRVQTGFGLGLENIVWSV